MTPLLAYQLGILIILAFLFFNATTGLRAFERLSNYRGRRCAGVALVSILVPARNAALTIRECLGSLLAQDYHPIEILVLDAQSEDRTPILVSALAEHDLRLRLIRGKPAPAGWTSRAWACHQLGQAAQGDYLLFTEPDTIYSPEVVSTAMEAMHWTGADLLSVWPQQSATGWIERLVMPLQQFALFCFMPSRFVADRLEPSVVAMNGRFMCFRRLAYNHAGGHAAVRNYPVEDIALARRLRACGGRLSVLDGSDLIRIQTARPYALWPALARSLFAPFSYSLSYISAVAAMFFVLFILPFVFLLTGILSRQFSLAWVWVPLYQVVLIVATRALIAWRFGFPIRDAFLHPFSVLLFLAFATDLIRWHLVELDNFHWRHPRAVLARPRPDSRQKKQRDSQKK